MVPHVRGALYREELFRCHLIRTDKLEMADQALTAAVSTARAELSGLIESLTDVLRIVAVRVEISLRKSQVGFLSDLTPSCVVR